MVVAIESVVGIVQEAKFGSTRKQILHSFRVEIVRLKSALRQTKEEISQDAIITQATMLHNAVVPV